MRALHPGDRIDNFTIVAELHSGAMAQIYRASERLGGEVFALKVPFDNILDTPMLYYHFQNEERLAADLSHPHIVRFFTRNRSRPYSILEFVDGCDLRRHLDRSGPLPLKEVQRLGLQICSALVYLHARHLIHLDLKPENLMLTTKGEIKLIDFGLARRLDVDDSLSTDFDMPRGTPAYASPEILTGDSVDGRSDLYSLGIVLYEMLTGELPFERSTRLQKVRKRLHHPPTPPRRYCPDLSPQWQELILTTLDRHPDRRWANVSALAEALQWPERLAVTEKGLTTGRLRVWLPTSRKRQQHAIKQKRPEAATNIDKARRPQILGAIVDDDVSDAVIERLKREALLSHGAVTLLSVVPPRADNQFTQYEPGNRGEHFKRRLDRYVARLRQYAIDPTVRIVRGDIISTIQRVADELPADILVMGATRRKGLKKLFSGSTIDRLAKRAPCPLVVAQAPTTKPIVELPTTGVRLKSDRLIEIDLFLIDTWVDHLNWLAALSRELLTDGTVHPDWLEAPCALGQWINGLKAHATWGHLCDRIDAPHREFHDSAVKLAQAAAAKDIDRMRTIYASEALPSSCAIRSGLQAISTELRRQSAYVAAGVPQLPRGRVLLEGDTCTLPDGLPDTGPQSIMREIHDYFCAHPDGSPESCLLGLGTKRRAP